MVSTLRQSTPTVPGLEIPATRSVPPRQLLLPVTRRCDLAPHPRAETSGIVVMQPALSLGPGHEHARRGTDQAAKVVVRCA
jgi:hypothetical protein